MKKTFRILGVALVATAMVFAGCNKSEDEEEEETGTDYLEVNVSQTPSKSNVLIEEFTGNKCVWCPLGHRYSNEVAEQLGNKCVVINYHVKTQNNGLSSAYTTTEGTTLNSNFNVENGSFGIPAAMFNRNDFGSGSSKLSKGVNQSSNTYLPWANQVLTMDACANVAASAVIDKNTRQLTVKVKVYYTADGVGTTNKLNVALLQNKIMGTQTGASTHNPSQGTNSQYMHNEMFRTFLTGQWGEAISPITQGSLIEKTYNYTIPDSFTCISDGAASEAVVLDNLEVVVFVAEGNTKVINVCKAKMTLK